VTLGAVTRSHAAINLSFSNLFPPSHMHSKLIDAFCAEISKRTDGEVSIQHFPGQTLTKGDQMYDGVVNGISDIGTSLFAYTRGRFPVMEVVDLPLGYPNGKTATAVINEVYREMKPKELDDVHVLYLHAHGPGLVNSRTKPIRTMDDMKGLKFRATGFSAKMVQALGGTPVAMPMPEAYQSLQKGVVDGATYPYEAAKGFRLAEVTKYTTENYSMAYTSGFYVVMNKAKWEALPANIQKVFDEVSAEWAGKTGEAWDEIDKEGKDFFHQQGGESITLSPEESARWKKAVEPMQAEYVAAATAKGVDGQKALEVTLKALEKYSQEYAK
jgi:TRAP-type C4-dicarboxylate transport system substrate-binding protein